MHTAAKKALNSRIGTINSLQDADFPIHGWYRFVQSFPPHLVRKYISIFNLGPHDVLFDPFCGTGTTLVEGKLNRIPSIGSDAHPFAALVSRVKTNWTVSPADLEIGLRIITSDARQQTSKLGLDRMVLISGKTPAYRWRTSASSYQLTEDEKRVLPTGFLSDRPLTRLLILRDAIEAHSARSHAPIRDFYRVALAHVIANGAGNFAFGPEIYRTKAKFDYDVIGHFTRHAELMIRDLRAVQSAGSVYAASGVFSDDAREMSEIPSGITAVITSPPYPNEKDYTRTTRVESILLRLVSDRASLREMKESLLRSNTRNIFVDDADGDEVRNFASIQNVCGAIEKRRLELKKDSGFEKLYHRVVSHYFGGMTRHLRALRPKLTSRARLAYVVGDQLSFLMVPVATARLLSEVAEAEGYKTIGCDLWRERIGTKVRHAENSAQTVRVKEEVLLLEKN
jgi:hypothetical protein